MIRRHHIARLTIGLASAASAVALAPAAASAAVAPAPGWQIESVAQPGNFAPGDLSGDDIYVVNATNVGAAPTVEGEQIELTDTLPAGLKVKSVEFYAQQTSESFGGTDLASLGFCTTTPIRCEYPGAFGAFLKPIQPNQKLQMVVHVETEAGAAEESITNSVEVAGGGAQGVSATSQNPVTSEPTPFGVQESSHITALDGTPYTQASGHPYEMTATINFNTEFVKETSRFTPSEDYAPPEEVKDITVKFPPGLIADPQNVATCTNAEFGLNQCPVASQVGTITFGSSFAANGTVSLFNLTAAPGHAAEFGYRLPLGIGQVFTAGISTGNYAQTTLSGNLAMVSLRHLSFTLWGVPADSLHNRERGCLTENQLGCPTEGGQTSGAEKLPFLAMPSSCASGPLGASVTTDGWNLKVNKTGEVSLPAVDGCNQVQFEPEIEARPTTNLADSPSGLDVDLRVPQLQTPEGLATAHLQDAELTLPQGMTVNPSAANGLQGCTEAEVDLPGEGPASCPDASKLGTVEIDTPLLDHPLPGAVYLAEQNKNPFGSLLAVYVAVYDAQSGVVIKLAGKLTPDQQTGQLTASFKESPQQPFEDLKMHFFPGAEGAFRTPPTCGSYVTTSELTPWSAPESGPPATPTDSFKISSGPTGGACAKSTAEEPNSPRFHAGTAAPQAGTYSPFTLRLVREDGSQELKSFNTTLPEGLLARLAGTPYCSEAQIAAAQKNSGVAEKASPSCPAASEIGTVNAGAGAGPNPYYVTGHAYLAGPYNGAPISAVIVTPAVAGPLDLGTVVVRAALNIDPESTKVDVVSDPIPTILHGIPLDLRSITVNLSRPQFTVNPTSCDEMSFAGSAVSALGSTAPLSQRFQVANCTVLPFAPKISLSVKGGTKRTGHPAFRAVLTANPGEANIAQAVVTLPKGELLDNAHLSDVCTRAQFSADQCPADSVYGHAEAITPLLDQPLSGPVYLRTNPAHELPDLVADLRGQIHIVLDAKVDEVHSSFRTTFEAVPDAPVTKFVLETAGGSKGLLQNSKNLCANKHHASILLDGQNGKTYDTEPTLKTPCRKSHHKHGKHHKRGARRDGAGG